MEVADLLEYFGITNTSQTYVDDMVPVRRDPTTATEFLRRLHLETPVGRENSLFYAFADRVCTVLAGGEMDTSTWEKFVRAGVVDLCLDIVARDDFWQCPLLFCNAIVLGTSGVIRFARQNKDTGVMEILLARLSTVWRHIWEKRKQWKSLRLHLDLKDNLPEPLVELLSEYTGLYLMQKRDRRQPAYETYLAHAGLHAWVIYCDLDIQLYGIPDALACIVGFSSEQCLQLLSEAGLSGAGADDAASCIRRDFSRINDVAMLMPFAPIHYAITMSSDVLPYYGKHALITEASSMVDRIYEGPGDRDDKVVCYAVVLNYLEKYTESAKRMLHGAVPGQPGLRGADIVNLFATGVDLLAQSDGAAPRNDLDYPDSDAALCERLSRSICNWTQFCSEERVKKKTGHKDVASSTPKPFYDDMKSRARLVWWSSLHRIQITVLRAGPGAKPQMRKLVDDWAAFGRALGLDTAKEQARYEKDARSRCAWRDCQFHREKPDGVVLSACKGCGEARYCGRECQKNDWSKGVHKAQCRRLR
ncbi:hypothetical protein PENSPDRAFT_293076 [Peniophora sp. CONT]|nr:hypothetical protein PENSPDRAFT_293076 [Peniophora sp. CONT]